MLMQYCANVTDRGPILNQYWAYDLNEVFKVNIIYLGDTQELCNPDIDYNQSTDHKKHSLHNSHIKDLQIK